MKINNLTKTSILLLLLLLLLLLFSCSKENIIEPKADFETKLGYSISYEELTNTNLFNRSPIAPTNKYLKVVYPVFGSLKETVRNTFIANTTVFNTIIIIDSNTDLWVFDQVDQPSVDELFNENNPFCDLCSSTYDNEYISVVKICYETSTTNNQKQAVRNFMNDDGDLMHIIAGVDCENVMFRGCCTGIDTCERLNTPSATLQFPFVVSDELIQN